MIFDAQNKKLETYSVSSLNIASIVIIQGSLDMEEMVDMGYHVKHGVHERQIPHGNKI